MRTLLTLTLLTLLSISGVAQFPLQISTFPPLEAETDTTGYVYFDFTRKYPYMKFINGERIFLFTAPQTRHMISRVADHAVVDSLVSSYEFQVSHLKALNTEKDFTISDLKNADRENQKIIDGQAMIIVNKDKIIVEKTEESLIFQEDIKQKNKTIKKQKFLIGGSLAIAIVVPTLILIFDK